MGRRQLPATGPGQAAISRPRCAAGGLLLAAPTPAILLTSWQLNGWALYSEDEVLAANALHPLFRSDAHFHEAFWSPSLTQRERLRSLNETFQGAAQALKKVGINAFLESSSLIGWLRHDGQIPWDNDGDLGIVAAECRAANATKVALEQAVGDELEVLKFACDCQEDCAGDNRRMAGRIASRRTGVCIDIFAYAPVQKLRDWQRAPRYEGTEWWERVDDHADYTFPRTALLPLQNASFEGSPMLLPHDPREFLSWEYGRCLGVHVWPWRFLLYTPVSILTPASVLVKGIAMTRPSGTAVARASGPSPPRGGRHSSQWLAAVSGVYAALSLGMFRGGVAVLVLIFTTLCELGAVVLWPGLCSPAVRSRHRVMVVVAIAMLLFDLRESIGQLICQVDDFYIHPRRPKPWTLCLFGKCWDFE